MIVFCDVSTATVVVEVVVTPYKRCREAAGRLGPGNEASVACLVPRLPQQQVDRAKKKEMTPGTETDQAADVITTTVIGMRFRFIYLVSFHFSFSGNGLLFVGLCSRIIKLIEKN